MDTINVVQQINHFKQILSYAKNVGFFFGAGTSCAFGLPNIYTLTSDVSNMLPNSLKPYFENIKNSLMLLLGKAQCTVEDILNHIRQIRDVTFEKDDKEFEGISGLIAKELDIEICKCIYKIIKDKEEVADLIIMQKFFSWYDASYRYYVKEIFTTNYDMLLEKAMESNYIPYFDGFVGSYKPFFCAESLDKLIPVTDLTGNWIRLWKIHGSLNWETEISIDNELNKIVRSGKMDAPENELLIYPSKEKYTSSRKQPFISYFDRLKKYLLQGELLFIISGYSFSDQHINEILFNCLRQNARLYMVVLCFTDEQVESMYEFGMKYLNLCIMGPRKTIINGKLSNWDFNKLIEDDVKLMFYWNEADKTLMLGDFTKLVEFLIENSSRKLLIEEGFRAK